MIDPDKIVTFCTESNSLGITYPANTSPENTFKFPFWCFDPDYSPGGSWFIMQIDKPGDIAITMSHEANTDLDFIALGPFQGKNKHEVVDYICKNQDNIFKPFAGMNTNDLLAIMDRAGCPCGGDANSPVVTDIESPCFRGNFDTYPNATVADCSSSLFSNEMCYIQDAKEGDWYLLFISNWSLQPGAINFQKTGGMATTNCRVIIDAESNSPCCEGESIAFDVKNAPQGATFLWTGPDGFSSTLKNPVIPNVSAKNAGEYSVVMYSMGYESPEVIIPVEVFTKDTVNVKKLVALKPGEKYEYNGQSFTKSGTYEMHHQGEHGCDGLIILNLEVEPAVTPQAFFSPNGDGVNDMWQIDHIDLYPDATVIIYDRWGKKLFETSNYNNQTNAWDGKYRNSQCPSGDYWFVIDVESLDQQMTGHFSLIR